jgi:hypothetical protein
MQNAFIRNRTEEFGHDIWSSYVLPPYYPSLGLDSARKSVVLEGGRGCGKTALLRYLSFQSQFSVDRNTIPQTSLKTIGLYLKADSQYFSGFIGAGLTDLKWRNVFEHALCLALAEQITSAIRTLNCTDSRLSQFGNLDELNFASAVGGYLSEEVPRSLDDFSNWIRLQRQKLSGWFKNFDELPQPSLLPLREFLAALISELHGKLSYLATSVFAVYIDEYENLLEYQQQLLNSLIKSGEPPLIFHIAMKPNGMRTRGTTGPESIQEVADFRLINLDDELTPSFPLFAAELFFFRLINESKVPEASTPIKLEILRCEDLITWRLSDADYRARVLSNIRRILPGKTYSEIAADVLNDQVLLARWEKLVIEGLKRQKSSLEPTKFLTKDFPEATIVCAALLHQRSKKPEEILDELKALIQGKKSKFKDGEWIHHFLLGELLLLYLPYRQRSCPIYAGFDAFTKLSKTNVRHFLELCYLSVGGAAKVDDLSDFCVPIDTQAKAAFAASQKFRKEVSGSGDHGNRLLTIVNILGKIFRLSQGRESQSEAERTHFSVIEGEVEGLAKTVLDEAIKWSVLFAEPETKVKVNRYESSDYVLNPIYAPFFGISFNKGRKLEIQISDANAILTGRIEELTVLLRRYEKNWSVNESDVQFSMQFGDT